MVAKEKEKRGESEDEEKARLDSIFVYHIDHELGKSKVDGGIIC